MNDAQLMLLLFTVWFLCGWAFWSTLRISAVMTTPVKAFGSLMVAVLFGMVGVMAAGYLTVLVFQNVRYMLF